MSQFHFFTTLPAELQKEVWRWCLPHRVSEIDNPLHDIVFDILDRDAPAPCKLLHTTYMNGRPPLISRVCREARAVAFEDGHISDTRDSPPPKGVRWRSSTTIEDDAWKDRCRDSVHLNWTPVHEAEYMYDDHISPLHNLAWNVASSAGGGSLMMEYLTHTRGYSNPFTREPSSLRRPGDPPPPPKPSATEDLEAFQRVSAWLIVMRVIVVHLDLKTAAMTGLFGLSGDARVQIIDASEEAKVEAFFSLAESCERKHSITLRQNFQRESLDKMEQWLKKAVTRTLQSEELVATLPLRPAYMFRLCTEMCNHRDSAINPYEHRRFPPRRGGIRRGRGGVRGRGLG